MFSGFDRCVVSNVKRNISSSTVDEADQNGKFSKCLSDYMKGNIPSKLIIEFDILPQSSGHSDQDPHSEHRKPLDLSEILIRMKLRKSDTFIWLENIHQSYTRKKLELIRTIDPKLNFIDSG